MAELTSHSCRWPIGDPKAADFSFCGQPAAGRYCVAHAQVSKHPGAAWRADRDPVVRRALAGLI
jgi:GcrA cell cycle regulator